MSKAGDRLIRAAKEAAAIARGEKKPARVHVAPTRGDLICNSIFVPMEMFMEFLRRRAAS